jgi:hypothetical protein
LSHYDIAPGRLCEGRMTELVLKKNYKIKTRVYKNVKEVECYEFYAKYSIQIIDKTYCLV